MPISISSPTDFEYRNMIHSAPISPLTCYASESCQAELGQNDDLLDDILAFLDEHNSSSEYYSPVSSPRSVSLSHSIKQWVEGLPTSPSITPTFSLPPSPLRAPTTHCISTISSVPQSPISVFSRINSERGVLTSLGPSITLGSPLKEPITEPTVSFYPVLMNPSPPIGPEPIGPLPPLPERSPIRMLKKQQKLNLNNILLNDKKTISMPDLKVHTIDKPQAQTITSIDTKTSIPTTQQTHIKRRASGVVPSLSEFNFPFSTININEGTSEPQDKMSSNQMNGRRQSNLQLQRKASSQVETRPILKLSPIQDDNTNNSSDQHAKLNESEEFLTLSRPIPESPLNFLSRKLSHSRSRSYTPANSKILHSSKLQANYRISTNSVQSRVPLSNLTNGGNLEDVQFTTAALCGVGKIKNDESDIIKVKLRAKKDSIAGLMRKDAAPGIRLGMRLTAEKRELLNTCRVIGMEVRLLTMRRRSLSGTRYQWLVVDNGMAVRKNTSCGRFVLRCLGESDGKVDFFTAEGIPIFRFQRTVGSTRTATSIYGDHENVYFSVRDGSWDCSVHWEVSLFKTKDQIAAKWLVSGDDQMQWLEIKQGDRTVGIIRDSGDHEYTLRVFPYNNWCIITALATFFDEWRASRMGLAL
ncbi:hypothetical protein OnM2_061024 [Erysiphe neolycopersici]|uniref:Uncharacterized protein n=1 Tax=Erysiphe neolycopersici TaxID=212602 RepID=A0A420HPC9_9PEZI|nr:hypothetical protein OnM2_061024 [Erysiphe neolycopersici]